MYLSNTPRQNDDKELLRITKDTTINGRVRVVNGSYGDKFGWPTHFIFGPTQIIFDEIYENGVTGVFGAGNGIPGYGGPSHTYVYPASYDFNISVSSVGHLNTSGSFQLKDIHDIITAGDSVNTHNHNDQVDICAPGRNILALDYNPSDSNAHGLQLSSGTSLSSPMVAGTCALMYSQNACLTPYQVEYLLKKHSEDIYNKSYGGILYNAKYAGPTRYTGRLGAGRLRADRAVINSNRQTFECNDPTSKTMTIDGVRLTHNCAPGTVMGTSNPTLIIGEIKNGKPPYRYLWTPLDADGNVAILNSYTSASPQITGISNPNRIPYAYFRLAVYDASDIQKVATVRFKAKLIETPESDLAMRDSHVDMLDEPNSQYIVNNKNYDIWHSPDFWNRDTADGGLQHQDPQYFSAGSPNYLYVRVRNVGCVANDQDQADLHLYWTYASTGEKWDVDWKGNSTVPDSNNNNILPGGAEITAGGHPIIPVIQPGDSAIIAFPWYPPMPEARYGTPRPNKVDVCVLARIIENNKPLNGLWAPEVVRTASNVNNNNNIVTNNFNLVNLGRACATCRTTSTASDNTHRVYIANSEDADQVFTIDMISEKDVKRHLSGDISKYCYVSLSLGGLYDRWQAGGGLGHYMSANPETKTVTYDPSSPLRLENVNLHAGEKFPVDITFVMRSGVNVPYPVNDFNLYIRQLINEGRGNQVYGAVVYNINIAATDTSKQRQPLHTGDSRFQDPIPGYAVYPNPVSDAVNIRYTGNAAAVTEITLTDATGKTTLVNNKSMQPGDVHTITTAQLAKGIYFIRISDSNGVSGIRQIVKR